MRLTHFLVAILMGTSLLAQYGPQTTTAPPPIFINKITLGTVPVPPAYNIGQTSHLLRLITSNQPTKTCPVYVAPNIILRFQGSWDGVTFFDIGAPITYTYLQPDGTFGALRAYSGYYPYLQVNLQAGDTTNCQHTVYYSGSTAGPFTAASFKWQDLGYVVTNLSNTFPASFQAISGSSPATLRVVVYGATYTTGTSTNGNVYFCNSDGTGTLYYLGTVPANQTVELPITGTGYFSGSFSLGLGFCGPGGTANSTLSVIYRYE